MENKPIYQQIHDDLVQKIERGFYQPHDQVPSEKELCEKYNVSRITAKKALDLISSEGYIERKPGKGSFVKPSPIVKHGTSSSKKTIACILTEFRDFANKMLHVIETAVSSRGDHLILKLTHGKGELEKKYIKDLIDEVDGFIIMPAQNQYFNEEILKLVVRKIPLVLVDRILKGIPTVFVGTNNIRSSELLISTLIEQGKKRIGIITPNEKGTSSVEDRITGWENALLKYNLVPDKALRLSNITSTIPSNDSEKNIADDLDHIKKYLRDNKGKIDAIFAVEYNILLLVEQAIKELHDKPFQSIELVCFDAPSSKYFPKHHYTHIMQNEKKIGEIAVEKLYEMFTEPLPPQEILVDGILILKDQ
ncbi:GntR family transcriptional regulator [Weizmannia acidilactici]|uniref:GntR family transcriptional regulator n=1 Tax=Weizmannia acidilactici TaxID=2607726 RepID=UPI00124E1D74|nr:GntR family transcriptional regulator [Weizmannia acidilactici]GER75168.1 transcriptional regulator [Weizmannia acidilactici]